MTSTLQFPSAHHRTGRELPLGVEHGLGYRPTGSLVLVVERGAGSLMRVDLPVRGGDDAGDELGRALAGLLARERFAERVVPVVFAPAFTDTEGAWEHATTAERVVVHLGHAGFVVRPGLLVARELWSPLDRVRWMPLDSADPGRDRASGPLRPAPIPRQRAAWAGLAVSASSDVDAVDRVLSVLDPSDPARPGESAESTSAAVTDVELVGLGYSLDDLAVRDHLVARVMGGLPDWWPADEHPPLSPRAVRRLTDAVTLLTRAASLAPESLLPPVLTVSALFELALGRRGSARWLLGAALEQDRDYALAGLVARLSAAGLVPHPEPRPPGALTAPATPESARRGGSARSRRTRAARSSAGERVG